MIIFPRLSKCLPGNTNFSAVITERLLKLQSLRSEFHDEKYPPNIQICSLLLFQATFIFTMNLKIKAFTFIKAFLI